MCELSSAQNPSNLLSRPLPTGWANAEVVFQRSGKSEKRRVEIIDLSTQDRYVQEPLAAIAFKCFGLFVLANPIYFLFYSAAQIIRVFTVPIANVSPLAFFKEVWQMVKIPFFFVGMQFAALYGIFKPLEGRALFGKIESSFHDGKTRREAEQHSKERPILEFIREGFTEENPPKAFFIAVCMQKIGNLSDPHIIHYAFQNS